MVTHGTENNNFMPSFLLVAIGLSSYWPNNGEVSSELTRAVLATRYEPVWSPVWQWSEATFEPLLCIFTQRFKLGYIFTYPKTCEEGCVGIV